MVKLFSFLDSWHSLCKLANREDCKVVSHHGVKQEEPKGTLEFFVYEVSSEKEEPQDKKLQEKVILDS